MTRFILYSRAYCHLCQDMLEALRLLCGGREIAIEVHDVDADDALLAQYDESVPVLFGQRNSDVSMQLCHYFFDQIKVEEFLTGFST